LSGSNITSASLMGICNFGNNDFPKEIKTPDHATPVFQEMLDNQTDT